MLSTDHSWLSLESAALLPTVGAVLIANSGAGVMLPPG